MNLNKNDIKHKNWVVLGVDVLVSMIASVVSILFLRWQIHAVPEFQTYMLMWVILSIPTSLIACLALGTQRVVIRHSSYRTVGKQVGVALVKALLMYVVLFFELMDFDKLATMPILVVTDFSFTVILLIVERLIAFAILDSLSDSVADGVDRLNIMVYGTSDKSVAMVARFDQSRNYNVIGFLTRDASIANQVVAGHKVYFIGNDIDSMKVNVGVEGVLFASDNDAQAEKDALVKQCLANGIHILTTPRVEAVNYTGLSPKAIKKAVENDFIPDGMSSFARNTKRFFDFLLSSFLIIVFSPLMLICYLAIKLSDHGPALYKQERIGRFGRPFYIYKFRSMKMDAESAGPALYAGDDDPRLTRVGKFLRQHHLDELPQLFNVWKGDMAFIGYRPERKFYIDQIAELDPRYYYLYQIRPGVTSYATLKNGYTDSMDKMLRRLEFDLYYLRHRSWWFDIKILWQTFRNIAFGKKF